MLNCGGAAVNCASIGEGGSYAFDVDHELFAPSVRSIESTVWVAALVNPAELAVEGRVMVSVAAK
jgi:hypothetical protein